MTKLFPKKWCILPMPKQVKEKAKIRYFDFLDAARFAHSEQAGNPIFVAYSPLI